MRYDLFHKKHRTKIYTLRFRMYCQKGILLPVGRWQIKLATGVSMALWLASLQACQRLMWMGFAAFECGRPLTENNLKVQAASGPQVVVTRLCRFLLLYGMAPESLRTILVFLAAFALAFVLIMHRYNI